MSSVCRDSLQKTEIPLLKTNIVACALSVHSESVPHMALLADGRVIHWQQRVSSVVYWLMEKEDDDLPTGF